MKKIIRLTESDLHNIINESVRRLMKEYDEDDIDFEKEWDERDDYEDVPSEIEVDVLQIVADNFDVDDESEIWHTLENELPYVNVDIETDYEKEEMDYYNGTGVQGGYSINNVSLSDKDRQSLISLSQNGKLPSGFIKPLIDAIEEYARNKAEDMLYNS